MKKRTRYILRILGMLPRLAMSAVLAVTLLWPAAVYAESAPAATDTVPLLPPVIITELLTGTKTSGVQEFIELYNTTDQPIDLTGWQLWYLSAQAANIDQPSSNGVIMLGDGADSPVIGPHDYYVLSGRTDYLPGVARQFYGGTMAATGGNVRLLSPSDNVACSLTVQDQLGWGNARYPAGAAALASPVGQSIARVVTPAGNYQDTYNNAVDFVVSTAPSPGAANIAIAAAHNDMQTSNPLGTAPITGCTPPVATPPAGAGPIQQPGDNDTPPATIVTPPTSSQSPVTPTFPAEDIGLITPQITELLPNTAPPASDATDEFIELYNSNDVPFDLDGFVLQVGLTTKHHYAFPAGSSLAPKSFTSFSSGTTKLALSNSGGQAALLDPLGNTLNQTAAYSTAKEGQAWALANGTWYWTTTPTPNEANVVTLPAPAVKKAATTGAAKIPKSTTSTKAASAKKPPKSKTSAVSSATTGTTAGPPNPLHPAVLAVVGVFALLYGLYEYRQDMANKFYQLRANRAARRAARLEIEGG